MDRSLAQVTGTLLIGGALIGVWLYFILFEAIGTSWTWWGLMGLVIGGGAYAAQFADRTTAIWIWVGLGIAAGIAVTAAFVQEDGAILAGVLTGVGAAMIGRAVDQVQPGSDQVPPEAETEALDADREGGRQST